LENNPNRKTILSMNELLDANSFKIESEIHINNSNLFFYSK